MKLKKLRNQLIRKIRRETGLETAKAAALAKIAVRFGGNVAELGHLICCEASIAASDSFLKEGREEFDGGGEGYVDYNYYSEIVGPKGSIRLERAAQVRWLEVRGVKLPKPMTREEVADYFKV